MTEKTVSEISKMDMLSYKNPSLSAEARAIDLVNRMTLEEKVAQMLCVWGLKKNILYDEEGILNLNNLDAWFKNGMGQIGRLSDTGQGMKPVEMALLANALQKYFVEETRLGIPVVFHEECLHGLAGKEATSYPQPIGLASTFNPGLIKSIFSAIAEEARARGVHLALTPVVDISRDPRWGRVEETFGEDPFLVSRMGIAAVEGLQGDRTYSDGKHIMATLKHFAAHGQPESGSNCGPVNVSERLLRDVFLFPFKEVIEKTNVAGVMASYNEIDGVPSHANKWLLRKVLREEWGFQGFVVSDYYAVMELHERPVTFSHFLASNKAEAAKLSVLAGVNIETPDIDCYPYLIELVRDGKLEESVIDELTRKLLEAKFQLGLFENPYVDPLNINNDAKLENNRKLALQAARETMVLLKNEGSILPLAKNGSGIIAVIGPNADRVLLGGYSGTPKYYSTVLDGIKAKCGDDYKIVYSEGCRITIGGSWNEDIVVKADKSENQLLIKMAVESAKKADIIVLALGGNEQTSREAWNNNHMGDRPNLDLLGEQIELFARIKELGKPIIVLLFNGRPKSINRIKDEADAIIECWYLGQETGHAIADVLFGDYNPSGKLPISFPRSAGHLPCYYNYKPSDRRGYLFDDISPLYEFGYGLSYTTFALSDLKLERDLIKLDETAKVFVNLKNTGSRAGEEVIQIYIHDKLSSVTRPIKELKAFKKISLQPGEIQTVSFELTPDLLAFTNIDMEYKVEPGEFEIFAGTSSKSEGMLNTLLKVE